MSNKTAPVDQIGNTWAGLSAQAAQGEVRFDPDVAATVAGKIIALLEQMSHVDKQITGGGFDLPKGSFGMLPFEDNAAQAGDFGCSVRSPGASPGEQTRQIYCTLASDTLKASLDSHLKVLNAMLDTYLNIGKMYKGTDHDSASIFADVAKRQAALSDPSSAPPGDAVTLDTNAPFESPTVDPGGGPKNSHAYADRLDNREVVPIAKPKYFGGKSDNKSVTPLDGTQLSYNDLYYLGSTMQPNATSRTAGFWWQMAGQLRSRCDDLTDLFTSNGGKNSVTTAWHGAGYSAAVQSMSAYSGQLDALTGGMYGAHGMLMHVASCMAAVQPQLPQDPAPPTPPATVVGGRVEQQIPDGGDTRPYLAAYEDGYAHNVVTDPSSYVPQIPVAAAVTTASANVASPGGSLGNPLGGANSGGLGAGLTRLTGPAVNSLRSFTGTTPLGSELLSSDPPVIATPIPPVQDPPGQPTPPGQDPPGQPTPPGQNPPGRPNPPGQQDPPTQQQNSSSQAQNSLDRAKDALGQMSPASARALSPADSALSDLAKAHRPLGAAKAGALGGLGGLSGLGGGGSAGGGIGAGELAKEAALGAKLFPRALADAEGDALAARAGAAAPGGYPMGSPGGMGGMGGAKQGEDKERKRAEYLSSKRHLEEAFGKPPSVSKPIVEQ